MLRQLTLALLLNVAASADPILMATMGGSRAAVNFDGSLVVMSIGETSHGLKLASVAADSAVFTANGTPKTVRLGQGYVATASSSGKITLVSGPGGHFFARLTIGGRTVRGMIDTGATAVALSAAQASAMSLHYNASGTMAYVGTANGIATVWPTVIPEMRIEGVTLYNARATISPGSGLGMSLIGMSALSHFAMRRDGDTMTLTKRY